jgi:hypothetical protein
VRRHGTASSERSHSAGPDENRTADALEFPLEVARQPARFTSRCRNLQALAWLAAVTVRPLAGPQAIYTAFAPTWDSAYSWRWRASVLKTSSVYSNRFEESGTNGEQVRSGQVDNLVHITKARAYRLSLVGKLPVVV